jgi:hypothetical protein
MEPTELTPSTMRSLSRSLTTRGDLLQRVRDARRRLVVGDDDRCDRPVGVQLAGDLVGISRLAGRELDLHDVAAELPGDLREAIPEVADRDGHDALAGRERVHDGASMAPVPEPVRIKRSFCV